VIGYGKVCLCRFNWQNTLIKAVQLLDGCMVGSEYHQGGWVLILPTPCSCCNCNGMKNCLLVIWFTKSLVLLRCWRLLDKSPVCFTMNTIGTHNPGDPLEKTLAMCILNKPEDPRYTPFGNHQFAPYRSYLNCCQMQASVKASLPVMVW
jgi:hypothetical protein